MIKLLLYGIIKKELVIDMVSSQINHMKGIIFLINKIIYIKLIKYRLFGGPIEGKYSISRA